jgi:hypothetical protein
MASGEDVTVVKDTKVLEWRRSDRVAEYSDGRKYKMGNKTGTNDKKSKMKLRHSRAV